MADRRSIPDERLIKFQFTSGKDLIVPFAYTRKNDFDEFVNAIFEAKKGLQIFEMTLPASFQTMWIDMNLVEVITVFRSSKEMN